MCSIGSSFVKQNHHYDLRAEIGEKNEAHLTSTHLFQRDLILFIHFSFKFIPNAFKFCFLYTMNNFVPGEGTLVP